jgi:O-antigen ligase
LCVYGLLIALTTLATSPSIEVEFALPKLIAFEACAAVIGLLWAFRAWQGAWRPLSKPIAAGVVAWGVWLAVTSWTAVDRRVALDGMHGRYNGLWTQWLLLGLFVSSATSAWSERFVRLLLRVVSVVMVPAAVMAIAQYAGYLPTSSPDRPPGPIGNPVVLAAVLGLAAPIVLTEIVEASRAWLQWAWSAAFVVIVVAIGLTLSRGPWVGLAAAIVVVVVGRLRLVPVDRRSLTTGGLVLVAALAATVLANGHRLPQFTGRVANAVTPAADAAIGVRVICYRAALAIIGDRPVTGVGPENFAQVFPTYHARTGGVLGHDIVPTMVHSVYLEKAVNNGLPGLCVYVFLVGAIASAGWRAIRQADSSRRTLALMAGAAVVGVLVQDLTGWLDIALQVPFWLIAGVLVSLATPASQERKGGGVWGGAAVAAAAGCLVLLGAGRADYRQEVTLSGCRQLVPERQAGALMACADRLVADAGDDPVRLDQAGALLVPVAGGVSGAGAYAVASRWLDRAVALNPHDTYVAVHRIELEVSALTGGARREPTPGVQRIADHLVASDPRNARVYATVARLRMAERRLEEAAGLIARAKPLAPGEARYLIVEGDIRRAAKDVAGAVERYRQAVDMASSWRGTRDSVEARERLAANLLEMGNATAALTEAQALVLEAPGEPLAHVLLGVSYQATGNGDRARAAYETALRLDPTNRAAQAGRAALGGR